MNSKKQRNKGYRRMTAKEILYASGVPTIRTSGTVKPTGNPKKPWRVDDAARSKYNPVECRATGHR